MLRFRFRNRETNPIVMIRPDTIEDESGVQSWLLRHEGGGWLGANEPVRREAARRLLYTLHRLRTGRLSEDKPPEQMIERAIRIPQERSR